MGRKWVHLCTLVPDVEQSTTRFLATMTIPENDHFNPLASIAQVEMISTTIAASTVTDSATLSTEDKDGSQESSSLEMSIEEEEGEDDADVEQNDDGDGEADSLPPPSPAAGTSAAKATEIVNNQHGTDDVAATPPERGEAATTDEAGRVPDAVQGDDGGGDGADVLPRVADGNAS